jgi:hypothetical protein
VDLLLNNRIGSHKGADAHVLLEILKADECHIELIMALDAHVRGELKKHEIMKRYRDRGFAS